MLYDNICSWVTQDRYSFGLDPSRKNIQFVQ